MDAKKTVLIAGSTGNIGRGTALSLAEAGSRVVLLGRKEQTLLERADIIAGELKKLDISFEENDIEILLIDFTDMKSVIRAAKEALIRFSQIDALILSVGKLVQNGPHILMNGHEVMFATSVIGPFLFLKILLERLEESRSLIIQVIAPFYKDLNWSDLESIKSHKTIEAYNRAKTCERIIIGEMARRYKDKISAMAFDPTFIIDKKDKDLKERWPKGLMGLFWKMFAFIFAKPPEFSGQAIAEIVMQNKKIKNLNGSMYKLNKRINKKDKAMSDSGLGKQLWEKLEEIIQEK